MKVLLANKFFYMNGGSERVFFQEREFLLKEGSKVMDFSMQDPRNWDSPYSDYFIENINYKSAGGMGGKIKTAFSFIHSTEAVKKLKKLVEKERPDIAHLHNIYHQLTPAIIPVLKKNGVKVVLTLHDCKLICPSYLALRDTRICIECKGKYFYKPIMTNCQKSRTQALLLAVEAYWHKWRGSYDEVDIFLSPSKFLAELVAKRIPAEKIAILHNGIDCKEYQPNYSGNGYALYFGRLSAEKGIETLLAAHGKMESNLPLKVVGTGPLAEKLRISHPAAEFLGYKSGQELKDIVANAAFVVVPSECYENCSMVVLESMAFGKPVIGSRIGGIPEQIENDKTGFLFEAGNVEELARKMNILAVDQQLRITMGQAGRKKLESEYSLSGHCRQLVSIYKELTG
ncbi:MAG: glycosyltransferase family 4 protein [Desulfobulbaceae bacterium]|nr:glycosyltransferase family 4 protein [Desulfobulbaceae bacterium]